MFWLFFRAMIIGLAGGLITLIALVAADPLLSTMFDVTSNEASRNAYWTDQTFIWLPGIVFGAIVIKVFAGATLRRGV